MSGRWLGIAVAFLAGLAVGILIEACDCRMKAPRPRPNERPLAMAAACYSHPIHD